MIFGINSEKTAIKCNVNILCLLSIEMKHKTIDVKRFVNDIFPAWLYIATIVLFIVIWRVNC